MVMKTHFDRSVLEMALIGYAAQVQKINDAISEIQKELRGGGATIATSVDGAEPKRKRHMSAAGRAAIAAATKKRWREFHAANKTAVKAKPKRKLSPAAKAKLVANLRKARAAKAAKAKAATA